MLLGSVMPSGAGPVVVFAKPWGAPAIEVVAKAGGQLMTAPSEAWIVLTDASDSAFVSRLYQAGAGFVASSTVAYACARLTGKSLESQ